MAEFSFIEDQIVINSVFYNNSVSNGPGLRTVLFLQGCERRCKECHNPQTWDITKGISVSITDLVEIIKQNSVVRRITISGGEPLYQLDALRKLLLLLDKNEFDIALYTGYSRDEIPVDIIQTLDYLKTGEYLSQKRTTTIPYIGSDNQVFECLKERSNGKG